MNPAEIVAVATGTAGLTAFLIYAVRLLWASHEKQDTDVRAQRDAGLVDNRAQTAANERLADAVEILAAGSAAQTAVNVKLVASMDQLVADNRRGVAAVERLARTKP